VVLICFADLRNLGPPIFGVHRIGLGVPLLAIFLAVSQTKSPPPALVIRDVTVIDCTRQSPQAGMSVLISDGHIQTIRTASDLKPSANAEVVEGHDKYLIPGLWNMHAHLGAYEDGKRTLAQYLAEGVPGIRDMGSPLEDILRLRHETDDGTTLGPHLVVAGPIVQGPLPFQMPVFILVKDIPETRQSVRMLKAAGVDFIKVQDAMPHDPRCSRGRSSRQPYSLRRPYPSDCAS
jgi:imidazolonepropionase-like amidohydrolase